MTYEEVKKDFSDLKVAYGLPDDMTGGYVDGDKFYDLLDRPTKSHAKDIMISIIKYGFQGGEYYNSELEGIVSIHNCNLCKKIYQKYISYDYHEQNL